MDLQADLQWIHNELKETKDQDLIRFFKNILQNRKKDSSKSVSIDVYNNEIDEAIKDVENNHVMSSYAVKEMIQKWSKE